MIFVTDKDLARAASRLFMDVGDLKAALLNPNCAVCDGAGELPVEPADTHDTEPDYEACEACQGAGYVL